MDVSIEKSAMRKVYGRLLPLAILGYFLAYVDRINVSFAGLTMRDDLAMSATSFGFAAGIFYWSYFLFEVPSNIMLEKLGARLWIARIMISWGILAGLTALVTGPKSFAVLRFLLGAAEAGFFPGIVLYFDLSVSEPPPCAHRIGFSDRTAGRGGAWRADFHGASRPRWVVWVTRLASDVDCRRDSNRIDRDPYTLGDDRQARASGVPDNR